jgi:glycosyltransferase involved in cell wall biosynthesis
VLLESIAEKRPDVLFIGRESFLMGVIPAATRQGLPCVLRIAGTQVEAVARGRFPPEFCSEFQRLLAQIDVVSTQAPHVNAPLERLGWSHAIRSIPNAVDIERFSPRPRSIALLREMELPENATIVLHASNMKPVKRPLDIVLSAALTIPEAPDLFYVIVGDGPLLGEMRQLCREKGVSQKFRFTGWVDYDRMPDFINLADAVVMPSQSEQQAGVYLETQACARVLLASDIPGARQVIEDGRTGVLFRMGDIQDLTEKTRLVAADANLRREIGGESRRRVRRHDVREIAKDHVRALREAMESHRAEPNR